MCMRVYMCACVGLWLCLRLCLLVSVHVCNAHGHHAVKEGFWFGRHQVVKRKVCLSKDRCCWVLPAKPCARRQRRPAAAINAQLAKAVPANCACALVLALPGWLAHKRAGPTTTLPFARPQTPARQQPTFERFLVHVDHHLADFTGFCQCAWVLQLYACRGGRG